MSMLYCDLIRRKYNEYIYKDWKKYKKMDMKIEILKEVLSDRENRLVVSTIILSMGIGIGGGLIASAYVRVPQ